MMLLKILCSMRRNFLCSNIYLRTAAQRLVLAAAAAQARHLHLPKPLQARGAYPEAAKPLSAANSVGTLLTLRLICLFYEAIEYG
jgi:hypothetical protein